MLRAASLTLLLSVAAAAEPLQLAAPDLSVLDLAPERGAFYTEHLASSLTQLGVRVSTAKAIAQVLGLQRQKQLLGCSGGDSCIAEIASALGADGVVLGQVGRLDDGYHVDLKVIGANDGRIVATYSGRSATEGGVLALIDTAANELATRAGAALNRQVTPRAAPARSPVLGYVLGAAGVASAAAGAVLLMQAGARAEGIPTPGSSASPISLEQARTLAREGQTFQAAGWACLAGGLAVAATGVVLVVTAGDAQATAAFVVDPVTGSAAAVVSGRF